eukprot:TRINITY_DN63746_c0_g1_i1.p1 TRINITY_DN63746_c0_g1~~TRINITY_DN63746_c0_g1_i1.p1  ORF type:complete len:277 (-),score=58.28 TRINITY_DN63746_c0_g1_i1:127-957(-)
MSRSHGVLPRIVLSAVLLKSIVYLLLDNHRSLQPAFFANGRGRLAQQTFTQPVTKVSRVSLQAEEDTQETSPIPLPEGPEAIPLKMPTSTDQIPYAAVAAAVVQGKHEEMLALLELGANLEDKGAREMTAIAFAAQKGDVDTVKLLHEKGASLEALDQTGRDILTLAAIDGHLDVVKFLLQRGVAADVKDKGGLTALLWASLVGHSHIVRALVEKGADIEVADRDGMTALKLASVFNKLEVVEYLVEQGSDPKPAFAIVERMAQSQDVARFLASKI